MAVKTYVYKTIDSKQQLEADVHYSTTNTAHAAPIAFITHGGGFCTGDKADVPKTQIDTLLSLGFVAVCVNYRLCPTISIYDGPLTDCKDCYAWCQSSLPALLLKDVGVSLDPQRLVAMGHSAGGTLALLMATTPHPPLAILDIYGAKYFTDPFWSHPNPSLPPSSFPQSFLSAIWTETPPPSSASLHQSTLTGPIPASLASPARQAYLFSSCADGTLMRLNTRDRDYARVDPVNFFKKGKGFPPTFFVHGMKDRVVPVGFSERAARELGAFGGVVEVRLVEGVDHAFDEGLRSGDKEFGAVREGLEFLARWAGLFG